MNKKTYITPAIAIVGHAPLMVDINSEPGNGHQLSRRRRRRNRDWDDEEDDLTEL